MCHVSHTFSTVNQIKIWDTNVQNDIKCGKWSHGNGMQVEQSKCNIFYARQSTAQNNEFEWWKIAGPFILIPIIQAFWLTIENFVMCNVHVDVWCNFDNNLTALMLQCSVPDTQCPMDAISTIGPEQTHMHNAHTYTQVHQLRMVRMIAIGYVVQNETTNEYAPECTMHMLHGNALHHYRSEWGKASVNQWPHIT